MLIEGLVRPDDPKVMHSRIFLEAIKQKLVERRLDKLKALNQQTTGQ